MAVGDTGLARVWDLTTGRLRHQLRGHHGGQVECIAYSPDGTRIGTASWGKPVRVWDAATGETVCILEGHEQKVIGLAFTADNGKVATTSYDATARVWDARTGKEVRNFASPGGEYHRVAFSPDGTRLAAATAAKVRVWDMSTGEDVWTADHPGSEPDRITFATDGGTVFLHTKAGPATAWDAWTGKKSEVAIPTRLPPYRTPDGAYDLIYSQDRLVFVPTTVSHDEEATRRQLTRPNHWWHARLAGRYKSDPFASAVHRSLEEQAKGKLAVEAGELWHAVGHFLAAELLRPKPEPITITTKGHSQPR